MTYIECEEFLTAEDFGMSGQGIDEANNRHYCIETNGIIMTPREFLNEKGKKITPKRKNDKYDGQITIEELPIIQTNIRVNLIDDDEVIGLAPNGKDLLYKSDDPGEEQGHKEKSVRQIKKEERIKEEMNLREKQFMRYKEICDEMKKKDDKRHVFLIPRGILIENYRKNDQYKREEFFKGNLSQDVLAVRENVYLQLIPLIPDDEIKINYYSPRFGKRFRDPIKDTKYRIRNEVIKKFDLTDSKINDGQQLYDLLKKPKK